MKIRPVVLKMYHENRQRAMAKLMHNPRQIIAESLPTGQVGSAQLRDGRRLLALATAGQRWRLFVWSITTAFWSLSIFICRLNTINSSSFDSTFGFNLSLQRSPPPPQMKIIEKKYSTRLARNPVSSINLRDGKVNEEHILIVVN